MKNMKNYMMVLVLGTMISGLAHAEEPQEYSNENEVVQNGNGKKRRFDGSRLKNFLKSMDGRRLKNIDGSKLKKIKEKLELFRYNIPGIFEAFKDKIQNGEVIQGFKDTKSKMESSLEKLKAEGLISEEKFEKMKSKFNSMTEKLKKKLGRFKFSSNNYVVSQEVLNEMIDDIIAVENSLMSHMKELSSRLDSAMNS